jgi:type II secretory ATPase GspE/PulE/Tfp pilus assembly ATPase PilB-like protein
MRTLRQDGADNILQGITSVDEVVRVTQKETQ